MVGEPLANKSWQVLNRMYRDLDQVPEQYREQVSSEVKGSAELHNIGLDLYNRKITFGQANKRLQDYMVAIRAQLVPIIKKYQDEIAAQKAAAEQQAQQRKEAASRQAAQEQANANAQYAQEQAQYAREQALNVSELYAGHATATAASA